MTTTAVPPDSQPTHAIDNEALQCLRAAQAANPTTIPLIVVVPPGSDTSWLDGLVCAPMRLLRREGDCAAHLHLRIGRTAPLAPTKQHVPSDCHRALAALADFTARARSPIRRGIPELHEPDELFQQLTSLADSSAKLDGRQSIGPADIALARRVGFDTIPAHRRLLIDWELRSLTEDEYNWLDAVHKRATGELELLGIGDRWLGNLTDLAVDLLRTAGIDCR